VFEYDVKKTKLPFNFQKNPKNTLKKGTYKNELHTISKNLNKKNATLSVVC
jgi:hypothetical protein